MKDTHQAPMSGSPEHNERSIPHIEAEACFSHVSTEQIMLDALIEAGFAWEEAVKLFYMRKNLYVNSEMRQRMAEDYRIQFVRWLYERGELSE